MRSLKNVRSLSHLIRILSVLHQSLYSPRLVSLFCNYCILTQSECAITYFLSKNALLFIFALRRIFSNIQLDGDLLNQWGSGYLILPHPVQILDLVYSSSVFIPSLPFLFPLLFSSFFPTPLPDSCHLFFSLISWFPLFFSLLIATSV